MTPLCACGCGQRVGLSTCYEPRRGVAKGDPRRYVNGHNFRLWTRETALEALLAFAERRGYQPVSAEATPANALPSAETFVRLFGSWNEAIRAAGFEPYPARSSALAKRLARRDRAVA